MAFCIHVLDDCPCVMSHLALRAFHMLKHGLDTLLRATNFHFILTTTLSVPCYPLLAHEGVELLRTGKAGLGFGLSKDEDRI